MKITLTHSLIFSVLIFCLPTLLTAQVVVDFEDVDLSMPDSFIASSFESGGVTFSGQIANYGIYEGYVASNATVNQDLMISPGALFGEDDFELNQYSAFVPENGATSNYGVLVFNNSEAPRTAFRGTVSAPSGTQFQSINVANTTFAAHSILEGDGFSDPFDDNDEFTLFIRGRRNGVVTGEVGFTLADGRNVVDEFTEVSLEPLGGADEISFSLSSTSSGGYGLNTPTFIAIDDLTFAVAEPGLLGDVNLDDTVDFLDISPLILVLSSGAFQAEADIDQNGEVNFLDIAPFIQVLSDK